MSDSATRTASVLSTSASSINEVDDKEVTAHNVAALPPSPAATGLHAQKSCDALDGGPITDQEPATSKTPSLIVSSASEPALNLQEANKVVPSMVSTTPGLDAPSLHDDEHDLVDSPSSLTHSTRSSIRSLRTDAVQPDAKEEARGNPAAAQSTASLSDTSSVISSSQVSRQSDAQNIGLGTSPATGQRGMPPPPPPRKPANARQDAASALSSVQRSRYGLNESESGPNDGSNALPNSTSAMFLTSWNKAKASMADKESRQAAARDAKEALKRGWANWNTKRTEARRGPQADEDADDQAGMSRSRSSRMSFVPGQSAWLASSPPDPTSFGLGIDKSSPEDTRSTPRDKLNASSQYGGVRSNVTDTDDDNASVHSNSSTRQPYRELRASKKVHGFDSSSADRTSSISSSRLASTASTSSATSTTSADDITSPSGNWDAEVPSLTPPKLALRNDRDDDKSGEPKRKTLAKTLSSDKSPITTPPALPQRKPSSSILPTGQGGGGGVSFIPSAASVTTGLASASGLPHTTGSRIEPETSRQDGLATHDDPAPSTSQKPSDVEGDGGDRSGQALKDTVTVTQGPSGSKQPNSSESDSATTPAEAVTKSPEADEHNPTDDAVSGNTDAEQPSTSEPLEVSSPTLGSGIKKQPGRATMMAIPGIPSMQKAGPQSFSAPLPPEPVPAAPKNDADTSPSAFRASSLFKMPSFGSPVMTSGSPSKANAEGRIPPPVPARPTSAKQAEEAPSSALGLTQVDHREAKPEGDADQHASPSNQPHADGEATQEEGTFAEVAKAEGPAADPAFENAQKDTGDTVRVGSREIKVPAKRDEGPTSGEETVWQLQL